MALELGNGQRLEEFWAAQLKRPRLPWHAVKSTDVKGSPSEGSEGSEEHGKETPAILENT